MTSDNAINLLHAGGNYFTTSCNSQQLSILYYFMSLERFSLQTAIISLNSVNRLIFVTVKSCAFFAVQTELLNIIYTRFGFKGVKLWLWNLFIFL
jgi:hypothetical protein